MRWERFGDRNEERVESRLFNSTGISIECVYTRIRVTPQLGNSDWSAEGSSAEKDKPWTATREQTRTELRKAETTGEVDRKPDPFRELGRPLSLDVCVVPGKLTDPASGSLYRVDFADYRK